MPGMLISVEVEEASDSWGFVGVIKVGELEAYRTLEAFPTAGEAQIHAQTLMAGILGESLAGQEWRRVRDASARGGAPTRQDFKLAGLFVTQDSE